MRGIDGGDGLGTQDLGSGKRGGALISVIAILLIFAGGARGQSIQNPRFKIQEAMGSSIPGSGFYTSQSTQNPIFKIQDEVAAAIRPGPGLIDTRPVNHKFWDAPNLISLALGGGFMALDMASTRQARSMPGAYEANPLMRNTGVAIGLKAGLFGASLGVSYALHRSGHHRAERIVPALFGVPSLAVSIHNFGVR
jgi:hypothetical protein